ncbi:MAG TPA: inorganic diphosphatase [Acidobacteriota bacterium]|nr:inorganic diphosphatase [Acidobacteriota bacterium]
MATLLACAPQEPVSLQGGPDVVEGERHFLHGYPALNPDGTVNAVIEIPAGTSAKWEVEKNSGNLHWERQGEGYRIVHYLPYPANYGMVPQTLLPAQSGGDGDPLDVVVLSPALNRGTVVAVRLIGVLRLLDGGERDDKLLAVLPGTPLGEVGDLPELERDFPGTGQVVETWFANYKGPATMVSEGLAGVEEATAMLRQAMSAYRQANPENGVPQPSAEPSQEEDERPQQP